MPSNRLSVGWTLAVALALPLALAACGRKGQLDPPPDTAVPVVPPAASSNYIDPTTPTGAAQPAPVAGSQVTAAPPAKTFLLDPLIR